MLYKIFVFNNWYMGSFCFCLSLKVFKKKKTRKGNVVCEMGKDWLEKVHIGECVCETLSYHIISYHLYNRRRRFEPNSDWLGFIACGVGRREARDLSYLKYYKTKQRAPLILQSPSPTSEHIWSKPSPNQFLTF